MADIVNFVGEHLILPILVVIIGGLAVPIFRFFVSVPKEVANHDARAAELNEDLRRWVRDRDRQLKAELRGVRTGSGLALYSGSTTNKAVYAMRRVLHEYRDEATHKVRDFSALARSEGRWHRWNRERRGFESPILGLLGKERLALDGWRRRPALVPGTPDLEVKDDPTANESSIAPLETESGLTWAEAGSRSMPI